MIINGGKGGEDNIDTIRQTLTGGRRILSA
jgi:hypothetical protein